MLVDGAPADGRPRHGRRDWPSGRRGPRAAADRGLRRAARSAPRRRARRRGLLDAAVGRVLRLKFRLGLFERPYVELPAEPALEALAADESRGRPRARPALDRPRRERRGAAARAGPPPRSPSSGPIADSARDLLGDYSHLLHIETLARDAPRRHAFGFVGDGEVVEPGDELSGRRTILDALRAIGWRAPRSSTRAGPGFATEPTPSIAEAVALARDADVADRRARRALRPDRRRDDRRVPRPARPRVPRPPAGAARGRRRDRHAGRARRRQRPAARARVGGRALRGRSSSRGCRAMPDRTRSPTCSPATSIPGGKLPVTMPRHVGQVPLTYRHHPTGGRSHSKGDYVDGPGRAALAVRLRPVVHDVRVRSPAGRPERPRDDRRRGHDPGRRRQHRRRGPATRSSSSTSATRRRRSPGRSSSCAASGASASRPASAGRSPSASPPSSSPTSAPTSAASSSRARVACWSAAPRPTCR